MLPATVQKHLLYAGQWWNLGGSILLSEAASLFNQSTTNSLKRECGGLQTLLKNHHQVNRLQMKI